MFVYTVTDSTSIRTSHDFSFFVSECLYHCPAILWLIVSAYTSLHRDIYSLALWISALMFGYIVTHCTCICTSLDTCFSVFSLNDSLGFRLYCHWLSVYRFVSWSAFLSMFLFVWVFAYIAAVLRVYARHFTCVSLSLYCLWICTPVSEYIIIHSWCICTCLDPCFCLSLSMIVYVCVRLYRHWLYVYRYVFYSAYLSISLYVFVSVRVYYR